MSSQLRVNTAIVEDLNLVPSWAAHNHLNSSSRSYDTLFQPPWAPALMYRDIHRTKKLAVFWCIPLMLTLRRQRQSDFFELEASVIYVHS